MKTVADVLGVARSNLAERAKHRQSRPIGRPPQPDEDLVTEIKAVIADLPTYGYRRVHAILRRRALTEGRQPPNHKRVYGAMKRHSLLLQRHAGGAERRHDGRIAVAEPNLRWCSDGFEVVRQRREGADRLRARLLRPGGDELRGHHGRDRRKRGPRPHGGGRRAPLRPRRPPARHDRMAQRQRLRLHRPRDAKLRARSRSGAENDTSREPAIERHGRGLRAHHQARLRPRQPAAGCPDRRPAASRLDRSLQRGSPAPGPRLPFTPRVHQGSLRPIGRPVLRSKPPPSSQPRGAQPFTGAVHGFLSSAVGSIFGKRRSLFSSRFV